MSKAKFKIGQLAKIADDRENTFIFGEITGVVTFKTGYSYQLEGGKITVDEGSILEVFVPIKGATKRAPAKRAKKSAKISLAENESITQ